MINLLSKRDQRIVQILDYLVDTRKTSLQALSKGSNVPERTLWGDIKRINEMCEPTQIVSTSEGVELYIPSEYNERYLFDKILEESVELRVLEDIFLQKVWSIGGLAERLFLSEVTVRRLIQQINKGLEKFNIQISSNPLEIKGDTKAIIQLFTIFFLEKYNRVNLFMKPEEIEAVELLLHSIELTNKLIQNNQDFNLVLLRFYVRLKYYIGSPQDTVEEEITDYVNDFDAVNQKFRSAFGIKLTPSIVHFCIPYLFDKTSIALTAKELESLLVDDKEKEIYDKVVELLQRFTQTTGMEFTSYDELVVTLFDVMKEANKTPYIVYDRDRHFVTHLELYNPILVKQMIDVYDSLFSDKKYQVMKYNVLYIFITHWEGLMTLFKKRDREIDVAIFFDSDIEHALFAKEVLGHEFGEHIHFEVLDCRTYEELYRDLDRFEVLITNKPGLRYTGCDILCLDEFFLDESWTDLRKKLVQAESALLSQG
ncbi:hypothetical protein AOC36_09000 [Erysipelothrix larvae]|uniref:Mga helix-turn-helix domain-containing protein n=1 Tax=Erysipelothrix larvae TaxID=1514105 RepID=A0A0X8H120_9FIRM|nr:helix-turn-helix domain-containing protein [Erysipelothrix larvae]AMC94120.1 hypothetical protein AOC36_09000 [Erysipelothrix larvae]